MTDAANSRFWRFVAHYCAECYACMVDGEQLSIDSARLVIERRGEAPHLVRPLDDSLS